MSSSVGHFFRYQFPAVLWAIVIYLASAIPSSRLPKFVVMASDKLVHIIVFLVFGLLLYRGLEPRNGKPGFSGRRALLAVGAVIVYGVGDELHQSLVPGRTFDVWDMVADGLGGAVAVVLLYAYQRLLRRESTDAPL